MKNVMTRAWEIAKKGQNKFGGKVSEYLSESLKMAWADVKQPKERVVIATDFDNGVYHVYWEKNGNVVRKFENQDQDGMTEAYGYLAQGKGVKNVTRYIIKNGVEQNHTDMVA